MTLTPKAKDTLTDLGLDRDGARLVAKAVGQRIIEESKASDIPSKGMGYDGWGLYDDGMPACRFAVPSENNEIVFSGQFRAEGDTPFVERQQTVTADALKSLAEGPRMS